MDNNSLEHHGVKGQKWGVRRYQNKDGTRTAAGKERYKKVSPKMEGDQVIKAGTKFERVSVDYGDNLSDFYKKLLKLEDKDIAYKRKRKYVSPDANQYLNDDFISPTGTRIKTYQVNKNSVIAGEKAINDILLEIGEKPLSEFRFNEQSNEDDRTSRDFLMYNIEVGNKFIEKALSKGYIGAIDLADIDDTDKPTILFDGYEKVKDESFDEYLERQNRKKLGV